MSKVVFVGNVPYNMGEEQLIDVFKSVGQVVGFRLVFDRDTGKPRGYGFCEFADHETAQSAVRNLNNADVGGRPLRIDLADSDPFLEGKTTVRGELVDGGETRAQWREREHDAAPGHGTPASKDVPPFLRALPQGVPTPPGGNALDMITQTLATMNPAQLVEVLAQFKAFVITHPEPARALLVAHPQLAYALFQALLLNEIVDRGILQRMLAATNPGPAPAPPAPRPPVPAPFAPPPFQQPPFPPQQPPQPFGYRPTPPPPVPAPQQQPPPQQQQQQPPPQMGYYGAPPPPPRPAAAPSALDNLPIDPAQRAMLMQVLSLTPEQIRGLPPAERDTIMTLRSQLGGMGA